MQKAEQRRIGNTALSVAAVGFGGAPVGGLYEAIDDADAAKVLDAAWDAGFRYFDTAPHYGQGLSERRIGDMLRRRQGEPYVLSTKAGRLLKPAGRAAERHGFKSPMPFDVHRDYGYDAILRSFDDSLQRLGLDRIDMLFMHDVGRQPHGSDDDRHFPIAMDGGYRAMDELRGDGRVQAIGLGVNEFEVCEQAMAYGDWDCFLLAGRYTLLEQRALGTFLPKCERRGCSVIIGGPYNSGILATGTRAGGTLRYDYGAAPPGIVDRVRRIEARCEALGVPLAAAALQFPLAHPAVASVIPGLDSTRRIAETVELAATRIPAELWRSLRADGLLDEAAPVPGDA